MKYLFILLSFLSFSTFAQNAFFIDKKGKKVFMSDDSVEIIVRDERISYAEPNKEWEKYIRFKDIDYAIVGDYYFKSFQLINQKGRKEKETAYFVVVETDVKKLLVYKYTIVGKYTSHDYYSINIVDNNNNILDFVRFNTTGIYKGARGKIVPMIEKHFSDCPLIINEFRNYPDNDEKHFNVLNFFDKPIYKTCK